MGISNTVTGVFSRVVSVPFGVWLVCWVLFSLLISCLFLLIPVNPDSAVFDYIGWVMSQGGLPYIDAADQNWPGQMFIHALSVMLFGNEVWSYRAFEIVFIIPLSCWSLFLYLDAVHGRRAAVVVVPVYQLMYVTSGFWVAGQRDMVVGPILIMAILMFYRRFMGCSTRFLVFAGVFIACATFIRPTMLVMSPLLFLVDLCFLRRSSRSIVRVTVDHVVINSVVLLFIGALMLLGLSGGVLAAWYEVSVLFSVEVYSASVSVWDTLGSFPGYLKFWPAYVPLSFLGGFLLWRKSPVALVLLMLVLVAAVVSILVQGKNLRYHLSMVYSLMAILVVIVWCRAVSVISHKNISNLRLSACLFVLLVVLVGFSLNVRSVFGPPVKYLAGFIDRYQMYDYYTAYGDVTVKNVVMAAEYINNTTDDDVTVLPWGRFVHINTLSERRSPFFAASFALLSNPTPEFSKFDEWKSKLEFIMLNSPPEIILLVRSGSGDGYKFLSAKPEGEHLSDVVKNHLPRYHIEKSFGKLDLLRYKKQ